MSSSVEEGGHIMMTSASFYMVDSKASNGHVQYHVLRLAEKIYQKNHRATIVFPTEEDAQTCDHALWTYKQLSFVPHGCAMTDNDPEEHPIWISTQAKNLNGSDTIIFVGCPPASHKDLPFSTVVGLFPLEKKADFFPLFQECHHLSCSCWLYTDAGWKKEDFVSP